MESTTVEILTRDAMKLDSNLKPYIFVSRRLGVTELVNLPPTLSRKTIRSIVLIRDTPCICIM